MPVVVEMSYNVSLDVSPTWKIGASLIKLVENKPFLTLRPHDAGLIRLLAHNHMELPTKQRYCLTHCDGFQALMSVRNEIAFKPAEPAMENAAAGLFAESAVPKPKAKQVKLRASQLQDIRSRPEVIELELTNVGANPDIVISVLRPAHPCDHVYIQLDADTIEAVVNFIRFHGMSLEELTTRRGYSAGTGVWKNGSAGMVRKVDADHDFGQKYQRIKAAGVDDTLPLNDQEILADGEFVSQNAAPSSPPVNSAMQTSLSSEPE